MEPTKKCADSPDYVVVCVGNQSVGETDIRARVPNRVSSCRTEPQIGLDRSFIAIVVDDTVAVRPYGLNALPNCNSEASG